MYQSQFESFLYYLLCISEVETRSIDDERGIVCDDFVVFGPVHGEDENISLNGGLGSTLQIGW